MINQYDPRLLSAVSGRFGLADDSALTNLASSLYLPGQQRLMTDETRRKIAIKRDIADTKKRDIWNANKGSLPRGQALGELTDQAFSASLAGFMAALRQEYGIYDNKITYISEKGLPVTNWAVFRKQLGKSNPLYFSPMWSIIGSFNRLNSALQKGVKINDKGYSNAELQRQSMLRAIRSSRGTARKLRRNDVFRTEYTNNIALSQAKAARRIDSRRAWLDQLGNFEI